MRGYMKALAAPCICLASLLGFPQTSNAQEKPITAIDIALEPDATMMRHARDANARLLKVFPKGFALDATHQPHVTMLQAFVRTADLDKVYAAANKALAREKTDALGVEGVQILLHPFAADRSWRALSSSQRMICMNCNGS